MTNDTGDAGLRREWAALQNTFDAYERGGLTIKLVAVVLTAAGLLTSLAPILVCALLLVLWLQEGIWRTFQARIGMRLLRVEAGLSAQAGAPVPVAGATTVAFQLHSEWLSARAQGFGLLQEYVAHSLRPTVAYPYAALIVGMVLWVLLQGVD